MFASGFINLFWLQRRKSIFFLERQRKPSKLILMKQMRTHLPLGHWAGGKHCSNIVKGSLLVFRNTVQQACFLMCIFL